LNLSLPHLFVRFIADNIPKYALIFWERSFLIFHFLQKGTPGAGSNGFSQLIGLSTTPAPSLWKEGIVRHGVINLNFSP